MVVPRKIIFDWISLAALIALATGFAIIFLAGYRIVKEEYEKGKRKDPGRKAAVSVSVFMLSFFAFVIIGISMGFSAEAISGVATIIIAILVAIRFAIKGL